MQRSNYGRLIIFGYLVVLFLPQQNSAIGAPFVAFTTQTLPEVLQLLCVSPVASIPLNRPTDVIERATQMATRIHTNSPLPAPAMHATHALPQSKSHVLAGVQDAYWSDDEAVRTPFKSIF